MAVTAKDIAKHLGVSAATVSMVLNNRPGIGEDTRMKIMRLAKELGYKKQNRPQYAPPKSLNLVIYKKHGDVVSDTPFFSELTQGIELQTRLCGYSLLISYFYESQDQGGQIDTIIASSCQGVILLATEMDARDMPPFLSLPVPLVLLDNTFNEDADIDSITINNIQGSVQAVKYLEQLGHQRIGHLRSSVGINNFFERREGYLKSIGAESSLKYTVPISSTSDGAYKDMKKYLASKPEIPTAFFADNDIIAISCIRALREEGCLIPGDVSIIGFDDIPASALIDPPLSTMRVPKRTMGILAVERLIKRINHEAAEGMRISVNTTLIPRASTKEI
jgi:LacI family transcriptional regulator